MKLISGKATVKRRHHKSYQKIKVNGLMIKVRVSLIQSTRRKMSLGQTGRAGLVLGNSIAGILVEKLIKSKSQM